jgi:ribosome production factor 1
LDVVPSAKMKNPSQIKNKIKREEIYRQLKIDKDHQRIQKKKLRRQQETENPKLKEVRESLFLLIHPTPT